VKPAEFQVRFATAVVLRRYMDLTAHQPAPAPAALPAAAEGRRIEPRPLQGNEHGFALLRGNAQGAASSQCAAFNPGSISGVGAISGPTPENGDGVDFSPADTSVEQP
jgi:hypothetical protein